MMIEAYIKRCLSKVFGRHLYKLYYQHHPKPRTLIHDYFRNPWDGVNAPSEYLDGEQRSLFLVDLVNAHIENKNSIILELGCNVGRNLNYLLGAGYRNLAGIEISKNATDLMKKAYPNLANAQIQCGAIENLIKDFADNSFNLVFTMAVLEHIHRDSEFIFSEMVRITSEWLIAIEDEQTYSWREFPRNYKGIFENLGMTQEFQCRCDGIDGLGKTYWARIFYKERVGL